MPSETRTMYMHTIDGRPASYDPVHRYVHFVGGLSRARLVTSLRQIRREQQEAIREAARSRRTADWADFTTYGYVLAEVPRER